MKIIFLSLVFLFSNLSCNKQNSVEKPKNQNLVGFLEGEWGDEHFKCIVNDGEMYFLVDGEIVDYPNGYIAIVEPGVGQITMKDGKVETFVYEVTNGVLTMGFERAAHVEIGEKL